MSADTIDAEFQEHPGTALATRTVAPPAAWVPSFAVKVDEAVAMVEAKREFFNRVMREGEHYGKIPGTGDKAKPALLKPGAELLLANMSLRVELSDADAPTVDYGEEGREGLVRYRRICRVYRQTGPTVADREIIAQAEGSCSSRESKYRWRNEKRVCPQCGKPTIIAGKKEYGGGFICWKKDGKSDGCGAKFNENDPAITGQVNGKVANPDLADVENTILKMADKRALVAAALLATGCSDIFTQDVEENESHGYAPEPDRDETPAAKPPTAEKKSANDPGSVSEESLAKVYRGFAMLSLTTDAEIGAWLNAGTEGRIDDNARIRDLSENEARRVGKLLKQELDRRNTAGCDACNAPKGKPHVFDGLGVPCPNDTSAEALKWHAAHAERNIDTELPL